jgi:plastocyanin
MIRLRGTVLSCICFLMGSAIMPHAQQPVDSVRNAQLTAHLRNPPARTPRKTEVNPPALIWLKPVQAANISAPAPGTFTLTQKNKMFTPHLLVVPVGSSVAFPNADPFFHNVFSLFDGKRFDLGLYEAGSTRSVMFSREGVSYIFCNIHSDMSAVVISLTTSYYNIADANGTFHIRDVPDGDYELHIWVEGQRQTSLDHLTRRVRVTGESLDLGEIRVDSPTGPHLNKFGKPYQDDPHPVY